MKKTLKNLIALESNVKIYVPSTINVNEQTDNSKQVDNVLFQLSGLFGGATSYSALGCWSSPESGLIKERVTICESYCHENVLKASINTVIDLCEQLKIDMKQEAISLEVNNKLYFI
jgi:hypothetical protein